MTKCRKGLPATGAIHLGVSGTALRNLVPKPPANMMHSLIGMLVMILRFRNTVLLPIDKQYGQVRYGFPGFEVYRLMER